MEKYLSCSGSGSLWRYFFSRQETSIGPRARSVWLSHLDQRSPRFFASTLLLAMASSRGFQDGSDAGSDRQSAPLSPAPAGTPLMELAGRAGCPEDIAQAFLASLGADSSTDITDLAFCLKADAVKAAQEMTLEDGRSLTPLHRARAMRFFPPH